MRSDQRSSKVYFSDGFVAEAGHPAPVWALDGQFWLVETAEMTATNELDDVLTNAEAARLIGVKPNTLELWRHLGKGPEFVKLGHSPQVPSVTSVLRCRSGCGNARLRAPQPTARPLISPVNARLGGIDMETRTNSRADRARKDRPKTVNVVPSCGQVW